MGDMTSAGWQLRVVLDLEQCRHAPIQNLASLESDAAPIAGAVYEHLYIVDRTYCQTIENVLGRLEDGTTGSDLL